MYRRYLRTLLIALVLMCSFSFGFAQPAVSGDSVCGGTYETRCKLSDLQKITANVLKFVVTIGFPILTLVIVYHFTTAWYALSQGNSNAYKDALKRSSQALLGFLIIMAVFGGIFLLILKFLGVQNFPLKLLEVFKSPLSFDIFPHAYAQQLPNPLKVSSLSDLLLSLVKTALMFFVYPAVIVVWVLTGFRFVTAQGNPTEINAAKKLLFYAVITTVILIMVQGFLMAVQGTVRKVFSVRASTFVVDRSSIAVYR